MTESRGESIACVADLLILEARALAALGEEDQAAATITQAERVFAHVVPDNEPEWARFIDPAYFFGEAAHCFRDLGKPKEIDQFAVESFDAAQLQRRARRGALSQAAMVVSDISRGEIEAAAARGTQVVSLAAQVNSSRCVETVADLKKRLKPFSAVPGVTEFNHRASELLGISLRA